MRLELANHERDIGPIGTLSRIVAGAAALGVPIALEGAGWWDIATALLAFPLLSTLVAWLITRVDQRAGHNEAACDASLCSAGGYGGCEALAFYNLLTGRRDQIGCLLFTPIDAAEARHHRGGRIHRHERRGRATSRT